MFSTGYLQTDQNTMGWLWIVILVVLLLLLAIWWFSRRTGSKVETPPAKLRYDKADDLTRIEGIGPKVSDVLNEAGITTYEDLARANPADVQKTLDEAGLQMMTPEGWIEQAELAAKGDWDGLERLKDKLEGGRKK